MTTILRTDVPYRLTSECRQASAYLKSALTRAPVLCSPSSTGSLRCLQMPVFTNYNLGIGAGLTLNGRILIFFSRTLKSAEMNYATHDKEALAIVAALKEWRVYLLRRPVKVSDHNLLKYLFTQPTLNLRQRRWLEFPADYYLDVQYKPGKSNIVADALSRITRRPDYLLASLSSDEPDETAQGHLSVVRECWACDENVPRGEEYLSEDGLCLYRS